MTSGKKLRCRPCKRERGRRARSAASAFTLVELCVVVGIVAMLFSILLASLSAVRSATRDFVCKNNLKTVVFDFTLFADENAYSNRGESDQSFIHGFRLEDFVESVYCVDEFWDLGDEHCAEIDPAKQPLMCPEGPRELLRTADLPCSDYAVAPTENVSTAFNMRLYRASERIGGRWILAPVLLRSKILEQPRVPLVFDADGAIAAQRDVSPFYAAPAADEPGMYGDDRFWFPAPRHGKRINVGFVGGNVATSSDPANEASWAWDYQPPSELGGH